MIIKIVKDKIIYTTIDECKNLLNNPFNVIIMDDKEFDLEVYKFILTIKLFGNNSVYIYGKNSSDLQQINDSIFSNNHPIFNFDSSEFENLIVDEL